MLGSNVPTTGGFKVGFTFAEEWGCECIQLYLTSSRRWAVPPLDPIMREAFRTTWQESHVSAIISHIPFLVNLASPDKELCEKSVDRLAVELQRAFDLGITTVVLHPGSAKGIPYSSALCRVADNIRIAVTRAKVESINLLVETMAGQGTSLGSKFEQLAEIIALVKDDVKIGVCVDTAHIYEAGYDIKGYDGYSHIWALFDKVIGIQRLGAIHVNDSLAPYNSRIDRHAPIGEGQIGLQFFHALVRDARFDRVPIISEVPDLLADGERNFRLLVKLRDMPNDLPADDNRIITGVMQYTLPF